MDLVYRRMLASETKLVFWFFSIMGCILLRSNFSVFRCNSEISLSDVALFDTITILHKPNSFSFTFFVFHYSLFVTFPFGLPKWVWRIYWWLEGLKGSVTIQPVYVYMKGSSWNSCLVLGLKYQKAKQVSKTIVKT